MRPQGLAGSSPASGTRMELLIQIIGWSGISLIIFAYILISYKKVDGGSKFYHAINLLGSIGVGINVFHHEAWPSVVLQSMWGIIAIIALVRLVRVTS